VTSDASWLTPALNVGVGNQSIGFSISANSGVARTGRLTIGDQLLTVTQAAAAPGPGCTFAINPASLTVDAGGATGSTVTVTAGAGCPWTAATTTSWITITSGASGAGPGVVRLDVAANTGGGRTGTVTIGGQTFTVAQSAGQPACVFSIDPASQSIGALGGSGTVNVSTTAGCGWSASTSTGWIAILSGTSGSGNGSVTLAISPNPGAARAGAVTVAGQTYTVNQAAVVPPPPPPPSCTYTLNPTSQNVGPGGSAKRDFEVRTSSSCTWTAQSNASWIAITKGATGQGTEHVEYSVASNPGPDRTGTITAAGLTFTVTQDAANCSYSISPTNQTFALLGGLGSVAVTATSGCSWTATSNAAWIIVTLGGSGTGHGSVVYTVAPNLGGTRTGTITIAGRTFTVTQN
jgi:hypothetical protein